MAVPHSSLTGAENHEPKGVETATSGQIYVANGTGSGVWTKTLDSINLTGLTNQGSGSINVTSLYLNNALASPLIPLATLVAANQATLFDTTSITGTYRYYRIVGEALLPVTNNVQLLFRPQVSAVFQTSVSLSGVSSNSVSNSNSINTSTGQINYFGVSNNAFYGYDFDIIIRSPTNTGIYKMMRGRSGGFNGSLETNDFIMAYTGSTAAVTGFQVSFSSGNIATGTIKIYGYN